MKFKYAYSGERGEWLGVVYDTDDSGNRIVHDVGAEFTKAAIVAWGEKRRKLGPTDIVPDAFDRRS